MAYATQPGTFPHRVVQFLKTKPPGFEISSADLAEAMDFERYAVIPCLVSPRKHGALAVRKVEGVVGGVCLLWRLGDGVPEHQEGEAAAVDASAEGSTPPPQGRRARSRAGEFRALMFENKLLATGMEIRDGVAIFTPDMILALKKHTDWVRFA